MPLTMPFRALRPISILTLALLSSCVAPPPEAPRPTPAPAPMPAPPPAPEAPPPSADWTLWPLTPGSWAYRPQASGGVAVFSPPQGAPLATIRCELSTRRVMISRGGVPSHSAATMIIRTSFGSAQWPATMQAAPVPQVLATRGANDQTLDQIAYSRGRFSIDVPGMATLILPTWAEITRVIEDCR
ncbi:hypothetical protein PX699_03365 [Sphingobium sp. H39-3-25]|uniref:hypothetical protein n=1 Tax=Sphingobium arseniciresistens TaxID=3030834 RepID=UPI0023B9DFFB|nr:hypothetical protein [Sphingobium arseniciresistens]